MNFVFIFVLVPAQKIKTTPQAPPHTARVALGAWRSSGGRRKTKIIFGTSHNLSLSRPLWPGMQRWCTMAWTKMSRKNKNHAASPTGHSAHGPGAWRCSGGRRKTKIFFATSHTLSHTLSVG